MFSIFALIIVGSVSNVFTSPPPTLVVLSFNDFQPQNYQETYAPFLTSKYSETAGPPYLNMLFPAKSFVTHFTLSTGAYPNKHGVYNDVMFDKEGNIMSNTKEQFQTNPSIVPIWISNQKAGTDRHSGVMMWPGADIPYDGVEPTYIQKDDPKMDWNDRADKILEWVTKSEKRANLVMAYFARTPTFKKDTHEADTLQYIKECDDLIKKIYESLEKANIDGGFNMILLSDHGTTTIPYENIIEVKDMFSADENVKTIISGPVVFVKPVNEANYESEYEKIRSHRLSNLQFNVYKYETLNSYWNLNTPNLMGIIIIVAKDEYTFFDTKEYQKLPQDEVGQKNYVTDEYGYDTTNRTMNGFLLGIGPSFKKNYFGTHSFGFVDVYPLLRHVLELKEAVNEDQEVEMKGSVKAILEKP